MDVFIYTECPDDNIFRGGYHLHKTGRIKLEIIGSRAFYYLSIKLNNKIALVRLLRKLFTGKGNKIKNEPCWNFIFQSFFAPIRLLFKKNIILAFAPYNNIIYYTIFLKFLGKNIVYHNSWPYWTSKRYVNRPSLFSRPLWKLLLKNTKIITPTKEAAEELKKIGAIPHIIPHSIDTELYKPKKIRNKRPRVLFIGRTNKEKGILNLLKMADRFREVDFLFAGKGELDNIIAKYGKNVKHLGYIENKEELAKLYASSDIFVLNSYATKNWEEWFGISLVEAMGSGLPIIATDCIGPKNIVTDNVNGFLIRQKDNKELEERLRKLIKNESLRKRLGNKGRKIAEEKYDVKKIAEKWFEVLNG